MANEESIGPHRVRVDGDTVLTRYVGVPELADIKAIHARFERVLAEHGRVLLINDMRRSGIPSSETRAWIADWARHHPIAGIVTFGASLPIRVLQGLLLRAASMLGSKPPFEMVHCASEAEAHAWVEDRRRELR